VPLDEIAACYGEEHAQAAAQVVGSFFGKIARGVQSAAKMIPGGSMALKLATGPLGKKLIQFIPGVGPIASTALDLAPGALKAMQRGGSPARGAPAARGAGTPASPVVPAPGPTNPFPSVEAFARQGKLCIPATWE
jgi:hypothetical protein